MFTGIVTEVGTIVAITPTDGGRLLRMAAPGTTRGLAIGDSVPRTGSTWLRPRRRSSAPRS